MLANYLLLQRAGRHIDILDQLNYKNVYNAESPETSPIWREDDDNPNYVVKLMFRCKLLWTAYEEVKAILHLIIKQEELFTRKNSQLAILLQKFTDMDENESFELDGNQVAIVIKGIMIV